MKKHHCREREALSGDPRPDFGNGLADPELQKLRVAPEGLRGTHCNEGTVLIRWLSYDFSDIDHYIMLVSLFKSVTAPRP